MITIEGLTKKFADFTALNDVSCTIPEGCIYGMVGSNGAGKSTFLRLLTGVYRPDSGSITIDGVEVFNNPDIKNQIAFVPDDLYFLQSANMNRMAKMYASAYEGFDMEYFNKLTELFKLGAKKSINTFSKGMKRQAATILALSTHPKYLFFDETFDGLDPVMRNLVKSIICNEVIENNSTAIITSHSLRELEDLCDQLALLHKGGLVLESDTENLKTSLFKIQIAFREEYSADRFKGLNILHFSKLGSIAKLIVKGDRQETVEYLNSMKPVVLDILPLTLEEIFTYEMEALGYNFESIMEGSSNEKDI